ncbi:alpha-L-rhamnosidase-related protein [Spirosoma pollinicola]|uniref:Glycogen debranching protein n=1 Tax=Spirosoma pollinicola TaxID=2057025 RepID=A0A2K8Z5M3_9BACT|nr:glycogen debranching protein [Spirosoma pollinicola]AUD05173.1 glycogen debranching protein [Spirosoma pollinicola]
MKTHCQSALLTLCRNKLYTVSLVAFALLSVYVQNVAAQQPLQTLVQQVEHISGKKAYLASPFVTAGNRLYMVGHQDGKFPDLGWHITGEMGGIWDHPIKLMDGFTASVSIKQKQICLDRATEFINYPFANKHLYQQVADGLDIERFQFVPDNKEGMVVEYTFINKQAKPLTLQFTWTGHTDLRPTWLGERTNMVDAPDAATWDAKNHSWLAKDQKNDWFVVFGANVPASQHHQNKSCDFVSAGQGCAASLVYTITVPANGKTQVPITIAGSYKSAELANRTFSDVQKNAYTYLASKKSRYATIDQMASVHIPDKKLEQAFRWVKYNSDWLIREVPEIGRGMSAGLPDYPWWFGADGCYTLSGLITTGNRQLVYDSVDLLNKISEKENGNGRIIHEVSTNGAVFNPGNLNEVPQFASMIAEVYRWTGDKGFLQKYFPTVKKGMTWLLAENDKDKNLLPDGFGMMEIHGMNSEMIDVAVYTQKAFANAAYMASELGDKTLAMNYQEKASTLKTKINTDFWVPESGSYADFIGTKAEALQLVDGAIIRADTLHKPWAVAELKATQQKLRLLPEGTKKGFVLHHNWVVNTPMETGVADPEKADIALQTASKFTNPFGVFVTGIDRDESAGNDEGSFTLNKKVFTYTGAVMTLPTGVATIGENQYGHPDKALGYLKRMTKTFSYALPGSIYEVSPDYGMVTQAWNMYSYAVPIIKQFFGIQPEASRKLITVHPQMPSDWDKASVEKVTVGDNLLSMDYAKAGQQLTLSITQKKPEWTVKLVFSKGKYHDWQVNGKKAAVQSDADSDFVELRGNLVTVHLQ